MRNLLPGFFADVSSRPAANGWKKNHLLSYLHGHTYPYTYLLTVFAILLQRTNKMSPRSFNRKNRSTFIVETYTKTCALTEFKNCVPYVSQYSCFLYTLQNRIVGKSFLERQAISQTYIFHSRTIILERIRKTQNKILRFS